MNALLVIIYIYVAEDESDVKVVCNSGAFPYEYIGDGDLSIAKTYTQHYSSAFGGGLIPFNCTFIFNNQIWCQSGRGIVTITSAETNNHEAGEWVSNLNKKVVDFCGNI